MRISTIPATTGIATGRLGGRETIAWRRAESTKDRIIRPMRPPPFAVRSANPRKSDLDIDAFEFFPNRWYFRNSIIHELWIFPRSGA
jgi:hypothetical protein